jgi:SAM-dependent methyltransferase
MANDSDLLTLAPPFNVPESFRQSSPPSLSSATDTLEIVPALRELSKRMIGVHDRNVQPVVRRFPAPLVDLRVVEQDAQPESVSSMQRSLLQHASILTCPRCAGKMQFCSDSLECNCCGSEYASHSGIPRLYFPHDVLYGPRDATQRVQRFYDENPFPTYADDDSTHSLHEEFLTSDLALILNDHLPATALIVDSGCGTGHLTNFLASTKNRQVIGADLSHNSLRLAKRFKDRCALHNASFVQMNLFRPAFSKAIFDVVIANSVLHHTSDPLRGFSELSTLLKPDGLFVLSLYNPLGRVGNDMRRLFYRLSKNRLAFLRWRNENARARFVQRYQQPWESRHHLGEVTQDWFPAHQFEFLYSSPRIGSQTLSGGEDLRYPRWPGDRTMQLQTELGMMLRGIVNDGLFLMIGRNKAQPKQIEAGGIAHSAVA